MFVCVYVLVHVMHEHVSVCMYVVVIIYILVYN